MTPLARANVLALAVPAVLLAGAFGSEYIGGLHPCEMCYWQRWPHEAALALAILAFFLRPRARRVAVALAAVATLVSGAIGVFHAGVEYGWWQGVTACTASSAGGSLEDLLRAPIVRCDQPQWTLFGISLAGYNAIVSGLGAAAVFWLLRRAK